LLYGCGVSPSTIPTIAYIKSLKALSDGTNACTNALLADYSGGTDIVIGDLDVATSGSFAAPTTPISLTGTYKQPVRILVLRSNAALTLGNSSFMFGGSGLETYGSFAVQYNNATSSAFTQYMYGKASLDTNIYDGASGASMRVAPNSASYVVRIPVGRITVNSGGTRTVSLKARASGSGAEAAYAGYGSTYPKLYAGANAAVGLTADTLIDTMAVAYLPGGASAGSWETLSGTLTATGGGNFTDNGQIELYMEVLGTAGWINVDTLAIT
jgi:hypothetical protein